jgi:GNAT superfamily N-acetyltransferase
MTEPARFDDMPAIRALLAEAYADDPLSEWIFPDADTRPHACAAWYGLFAEQYVRGAQATLVREGARVAAVALWRMPGDRPLSSDGVPGIAGLMTALVGRQRAGEIGDGLHAVGSVQPSEPHAYLNFLAVAAARRRTGLGRLVLQPMVEAARRAELFVHLETTNPANHTFYEALGFRETARVGVGADGPALRALRLG